MRTPAEFIALWRDNPLSERAGAQPFFLDLCEILGVAKPGDPENYCFERGAARTGAGRGWADVWKRGCFAWENKAPGGHLGEALKQLMTYALALDNPPLLVVCDRRTIEIHTHFTGTPSEAHVIRLEEIGRPENLAKLRAVFDHPAQFRPRRTDRDITLAAAGRFADLAGSLERRGHDPRQVAHYDGRVPGGADLVCYWFEKARAQLEAGKAQRAGLVATQAIRKGANRTVLERILNTPLPPQGLEVKARIFNAWSDEPWINDGAAVRVSLVCFGSGEAGGISLDGHPVATVNADLTAGETDLTRAVRLRENIATCFQGPVKVGAFDIPGELARQWLQQPNPHGRPNGDVLRPWANGMDITRRPSDTWIIDFGGELSEAEAALYEAPFAYVLAHVKPERERNRRALRARYWWRHGEVMPGMRKALARVPRYIATPRVAKHRLFVWLYSAVLPDSRLYVIARDDDATCGILHSRIHEVWALANASRHGVGNDPTYNAATCFETFPFPPGLQPNRNALTPTPLPQAGEGPQFPAIAEAARRLNALRQNWLNPPEWVERVPEIVPGYPDRLLPKPEFAAELNRRTLTNLYNARPAWLDQAHRQLDAAVAAAYGWDDYQPAMPDAEILRRLLALNRQLAGGFAGGPEDWRHSSDGWPR